jgi:cellulose synthase/poly-beta-1,6-N-acetylglucosamine synthase-like glycosyltransferase
VYSNHSHVLSHIWELDLKKNVYIETYMIIYIYIYMCVFIYICMCIYMYVYSDGENKIIFVFCLREQLKVGERKKMLNKENIKTTHLYMNILQCTA